MIIKLQIANLFGILCILLLILQLYLYMDLHYMFCTYLKPYGEGLHRQYLNSVSSDVYVHNKICSN